MTSEENHAFETIGVGDLEKGNETVVRRNIPIVMLLQGETIGKKYLLQKSEMLIGRAPNCDIILSDFEISRRHTIIAYENMERASEPPRCVIRDLGSKNGTYVNGEKADAQVLRDKDIIAIGSVVLGFYLKDEIEVKFDSELYSMATIDSLTGVYNKYYFQRELQRELQRAMRGKAELALIFCDLDAFKKVNDTYGHLAGDAILRRLGEILLGNVREYDICARYGGDEFAIILPATDLKDAMFVANRLHTTVNSQAIPYQNLSIPITVSIGVAPLLEYMTTVEDLVGLADKALYKAKEQGRNQVCCLNEKQTS